MSRIVAYGDSFTVGQGLDLDDLSPEIPDKNSWPYILAKSLNFDCSNRACCGIGNKHIWHVVLNSEHKKDDTVILCWSFPDRVSILTDAYTPDRYPETRTSDDSSVDIYQSDIYTIGPWLEEEPVISYYSNLHNSTDGFINTLLYMNHVDTYLKNIGVNKIIHTAVPLVPEYEMLSEVKFSNQIWNYTHISNPHWNNISMPFTMTGAAMRFGETHDGHISAKGHKYFAAQFLTILS